MTRKTTLKDLAVHLGVSTATVSKALNNSHEISDQLKKSVQDYSKKIGYIPDRIASALRSGKTMTIGVVVPSIAYNFNVRAIEGIEEVLSPLGYMVLIFQTMENYLREKSAIEYLLSTNTDGIIASVATETNNYSHFEKIRKQGKPLVLLDRTCKYVEASEVVIDNEAASYQAVKHLLEIGRRKIAWITGPKVLPLTKLRQRGYEKALKEYSISFESKLICYCEFNSDMGFTVTRKLLKSDPSIDAIYAINDRIAIGAMGAIHSLEKEIPKDIAVVGFNNEPFDTLLNPSLSSIYQPSQKMGQEAADLMIKHLSEATFVAQRRMFNTQLIVRGSSGR